MNLLEKVAKALEPFASRYDPTLLDHEVLYDRGTSNGYFGYAAAALAAVREAQAKPQGFDAWAESEYLDGLIGESSTDTAMKAYLAGQLSGIPAELRETLIEACIEAEGAHMAASSMWRDQAEHKAQDEADAAKRVAEARKWLEGSR